MNGFQLLTNIATKAVNSLGSGAYNAYQYLQKNAPEVIRNAEQQANNASDAIFNTDNPNSVNSRMGQVLNAAAPIGQGLVQMVPRGLATTGLTFDNILNSVRRQPVQPTIQPTDNISQAIFGKDPIQSLTYQPDTRLSKKIANTISKGAWQTPTAIALSTASNIADLTPLVGGLEKAGGKVVGSIYDKVAPSLISKVAPEAAKVADTTVPAAENVAGQASTKTQQLLDAQANKVTDPLVQEARNENPIYKNLDKGDLSLYGKDVAKVGGSRTSITDQIGVLSQAHNSQTIRSLARRIMDRVNDPVGLQRIKNELDNPDTYPKIGGPEAIRKYKDEVNILRDTIDKLSPSNSSQPSSPLIGGLEKAGGKLALEKAIPSLASDVAPSSISKIAPEAAQTADTAASVAENAVGKAPTKTQQLLDAQKTMRDTVKNTQQVYGGAKNTATKVKDYLIGNGQMRGSQGVMASDSPAGKIISDTIDTANNAAKDLYGQAQAQLRTAFQGLNKNELASFSDVVEGKMIPISNAQAQAVKTWQGISKDIHDMATQTGMKVGKIENYFPHYGTDGKMISSDGFTIGSNANHDFGNLVKSRGTGNAPYSKDPNKLFDYIQSAYDNVVKRSYFGERDKNLYNLAKKTANPGQVSGILDSILGKGNVGGLEDTVASKITSLESTKLGATSPLTNLTQQLSAISRTDIPTAIKTYTRMIQNPEQTMINAIKAGELNPNVGMKILKSLQETPNMSIGQKWLRVIRFGAAENMNRIFSVNAGMEYASKIVSQAKQGSAAAIRELERLGMKNIVNPTEEDLIRAGRKISQETQFNTGKGELPQGWQTPAGKVITQFKSFAYKQTGFVKNEAVRIGSEALKGNFKPLATTLATYGVGGELMGEVINDVRSLVTNNKRKDMGVQRYVNNILAATSLGLLDNTGALLGKYGEGGVISTIGGPTAGDAYKGRTAYTDASKGIQGYDPTKSAVENLDPNNTTRRAVLKAVPGVGSGLSNSLVPNSYVDNPTNVGDATGINPLNIVPMPGGINNGLSSPDTKSYNSLKQIDPTAAAAFKANNQYSDKAATKDKASGGLFDKLFGSNKPTDWSTKPTTKQELKDFNIKVDTALENGASNIPDSAIITRFFDGKTYDPTSTSGQQDTLNKMISLIDNKDTNFLTDQQLASIANSAKIPQTDLSYYRAASSSETDRMQSFLGYASSPQTQDPAHRDEFLQSLMMGKREVAGKSVLSTGILNRLYDEGLITKDEKALITNVKYDSIFNKFYMDRDYKGSGGGLSPSQLKAKITALNTIFKMHAPTKPKKQTVTAPAAPTLNLKRSPSKSASSWFSGR